MTSCESRLQVTALIVCVSLAGCDSRAEGEPDTEQRASTALASPGEAVTPDSAAADPASLPLDSLLSLAIDAYYERGLEVAGALFETLEARARSDGSAGHLVQALIWRANVHRFLGPLDSARVLAGAAIHLATAEGVDEHLSRAYSTAGLVAWWQYRLVESADLQRKAFEIAERQDDPQGIARAQNNLALVEFELGNFDVARAGFEATRQAGEVLAETLYVADALNNLAMVDSELGELASAIERSRQARELYRALGAVDREELAISQLGTAYLRQGALGRAHAAFDTAISLARAQGLEAEEAEELSMLAEVYRQAGDPARAIRHFEEAAAINESLGIASERGTLLRRAAEVYGTMGDYEGGTARVEQAIALHEEAGARYEVLLDRITAAELAQVAGDPARATRHLDSARRLAEILDTRSALAEYALAAARLGEARGDPQYVLATLESSRPSLERGGFQAEWESAALRARAHLAVGQLEEALAAGRAAVSTVQRVRSELASGFLRSRYASSHASTFWTLADVLLRVNRPEQAFEVVEAARSWSPVGHRAERASEDLRARGRELLIQVDHLAAALDSVEFAYGSRTRPEVRAVAEDLSSRLESARQAYEDHLITLAESQSSITTSQFGGTSVDEVRSWLAPQEALVEYVVMEEELLAFVVTSSGLRVHRVELPSGSLAQRVRLALGLLARPDGEPATMDGVLTALYEAVLSSPVRSLGEKVTTLYIVPDGPLAYLPFAALRDPASGQYAVQRFDFAHLPSARALQSHPDGPSTGVSSPPAVRVFAPFPDELPGTDREAKELRNLLTAEIQTGERAAESDVRAALRRDAAVHLATHGVMNAQAPVFSRVHLAAGSGAPEDDGRLEVHELLDLEIEAPLVYLSGCETAIGPAWATEFSRFEDYATLERALLGAGAREVVATLWRIEDASAARFAVRFYTGLDAGGAASALASAQRMSIASGEVPYHWAAYRASGGGAVTQ